MQRTTAGIALLAASTVFGCGHEKNREPAMTPASSTEQQQQQRVQYRAQDETWTEESTMPSAEQSGNRQGQGMQQGTEQQGSTDQSQPGMASSSHDQALQLAQARCRRESRCNQVGANSKYATQQECEQTLMADNHKTLDACANGMNQANMTECTAAIDSAGCDYAMDRLSDYRECRSESMCLP